MRTESILQNIAKPCSACCETAARHGDTFAKVTNFVVCAGLAKVLAETVSALMVHPTLPVVAATLRPTLVVRDSAITQSYNELHLKEVHQMFFTPEHIFAKSILNILTIHVSVSACKRVL